MALYKGRFNSALALLLLFSLTTASVRADPTLVLRWGNSMLSGVPTPAGLNAFQLGVLNESIIAILDNGIGSWLLSNTSTVYGDFLISWWTMDLPSSAPNDIDQAMTNPLNAYNVTLPPGSFPLTGMALDSYGVIWAVTANGSTYAHPTVRGDDFGYLTDSPPNTLNFSAAAFGNASSGDDVFIFLSGSPSNSFLGAYGITNQGNLYLRESSTCLLNYADASLGANLNPIALPPFSGVPLLDIGFERALININNTIYMWGLMDSQATGLIGYVCHPDPIALNLTAFEPATWTHLALADRRYLLIADNGNAVMVDLTQMAIEPNITALIRSGNTSPASAFLVQVETGVSGFFFLMEDGNVWTWIFPENGQVSYDMMATISWLQTGLVLNHFGVALPSNYRVTQIHVIGGIQAFVALAKPKSAADQIVPPLPPTYYNTSSLFVWDVYVSPNFDTANRITGIVFPTTYMQPGFENQFHGWVYHPNSAACIANGTVLTTGQGPALSPMASTHQSMGLSLPTAVDRRFMLGFEPLSLALGAQDLLVLLSNGTILAWGGSYFQLPNAGIPAEIQVNHGEFWLDPISFAKPMYFPSTASVVYNSIHAFANAFCAVDTQGILHAFGIWNGTFIVEPTPLPNFYAAYGPVAFLALGSATFDAFAITNGSNPRFVQIFTTPVTNETVEDIPVANYAEISLAGSSLNTSDIVQMIATEYFVAFLTAHSGIYGYVTSPTSTFAAWTILPGMSAPAPYPVPIQLDGIPPASTIKKIALSGLAMYILDNKGQMFASANADSISLNFNLSLVTPVMVGYEFKDIFSCSGPNGCNYKVAQVRTNVNLTKDTSQEYLGLVFGWSASVAAANSTALPNTNEYIRVLPNGHPLESANLDKVEIGLTSMTVQDGNMTDKPKLLMWASSLAYGAGLGAVSTPTFVPQLLVDEHLLKVTNVANANYGSLMWAPLYVFSYDNCSMRYGLPPTAISPLISTGLHSPLARTDVNSTASRMASNSTWVIDGELPFEEINIPFNTSECEANAHGPLIDIQCSDFFYQPLFEVMGPDTDVEGFWCVSRTANASQSPFLTALYAWQTTHMDTLGLFGTQEEVDASTVQQQYTSWYVTTRQLSFDSLLAQYPMQTLALSLANGAILHKNGMVSVWGWNDRRQLGIEGITNSSIPMLIDFSAHPGFVATSVVPTSRAILAVSNTSILAWGDNTFGLLGNGSTHDQVLWSSSPVAVRVPVGPFQKVICSSYSCYVLYANGDLYSWGAASCMGLGRQTSNYYDPLPQIADALQFPGPNPRKIVDIFTSSSTGAIIVRGLKLPLAPTNPPPTGLPPVPVSVPVPTAPPPTAIQCIGEPPLPSFFCANGTWIGVGIIIIGGDGSGNGSSNATNTVTISGPTFINGSVIVEPGATVIFTIPTVNVTLSDTPLLNLTGCFVLNGTIAIGFDQSSWDSVRNTLNGHSLTIAESSCVMLNGTTQQSVMTPQDCKKTNAELSNRDLGGGRYSLVSTFVVDSAQCDRWWIILASVLGGVLLLTAAGVIGYRVFRQRIFGKDKRRLSSVRASRTN